MAVSSSKMLQIVPKCCKFQGKREVRTQKWCKYTVEMAVSSSKMFQMARKMDRKENLKKSSGPRLNFLRTYQKYTCTTAFVPTPLHSAPSSVGGKNSIQSRRVRMVQDCLQEILCEPWGCWIIWFAWNPKDRRLGEVSCYCWLQALIDPWIVERWNYNMQTQHQQAFIFCFHFFYDMCF